MQTQTSTSSAIYVKMIISAFETQNARVDKLLASLTDEQLMTETAPGRNSGFYLLGHLAAVNDAMLPLLGFGEKLHPELAEQFLSNPHSASIARPSVGQLKGYWTAINAKLNSSIEALTPDEWLTRHNSVTPEDFAKEPTRNKLNILINRANHAAYHIGQLNYLVTKK